jgi:hypothetical protein
MAMEANFIAQEIAILPFIGTHIDDARYIIKAKELSNFCSERESRHSPFGNNFEPSRCRKLSNETLHRSS